MSNWIDGSACGKHDKQTRTTIPFMSSKDDGVRRWMDSLLLLDARLELRAPTARYL